jgi:two-component system, sporulation sensor kinase E
MKSGFMDKLIDRLDRIDSKSLQGHFLRLAREKGLLETIFQSIQEGIIVIDGSCRLTYANKAAENLIGFSLDAAQGRPVSGYLRNIDWSDILKFDENEWTKLVTREIEITYPTHKFVAFYVVPLSWSSEGEKGAVVILRDITPDREHESTVVESERINAIKLLAAGVAHEIGNPINALNIHLQLLDREIERLPAKSCNKKELKELAGVARNEMSRLDMIVSQFLRAVRPAKPKFALQKIDSILKETLTLLKQEIINRDIKVEVECPESLARAKVDKGQIKQAFVNIIRNAIQAMPDGGKLRIRLSSSDQFVGISFRDTGVGIGPEHLGRIFEPYYSTKSEGSGLGLMIVQRIVQEHGGRIEVGSKPDEGTIFTVYLPLGERRVRLLTRGEEENGERR